MNFKHQVISALILSGLITNGCSPDRPVAQSNVSKRNYMTRQEITVPLCGPLHLVNGLEWPKLPSGEYVSVVAKESPCHLILQLPGRKSFRVDAQAVTLNQYRGIVYSATVLPLEKAVTYENAVDEALKLLVEVMGESNPQVEDWVMQLRSNRPADDPFELVSTRLQIEGDTTLFVRLRYSEQSVGWFITLEFSSDVESLFGTAPTE